MELHLPKMISMWQQHPNFNYLNKKTHPSTAQYGEWFIFNKIRLDQLSIIIAVDKDAIMPLLVKLILDQMV